MGNYPAVSLLDARDDRDFAKKQLAKGIDPSLVRRTAQANTFNSIADEYLAQQRQRGRAEATLSKLEWLLSFANDAVGERPITEIRPIEVLAILRRIEAQQKYETACRLRSTIGCVFRYAVQTGRAELDPTAVLRGAIGTPP